MTERQKDKNTSAQCYVKAALPQVLDLLVQVHIRYAAGSESALSVLVLKNLVINLYAQNCVPSLNDELEESPLQTQLSESPDQALRRVKEVLEMYNELNTKTIVMLDWNCAEEYSHYTPTAVTAATTELLTTEADMLGVLEQNHLSDPHSSFYRLGFILLAVCGGICLIAAISCFMKKRRQLQVQSVDSERLLANALLERRHPLSI